MADVCIPTPTANQVALEGAAKFDEFQFSSETVKSFFHAGVGSGKKFLLKTSFFSFLVSIFDFEEKKTKRNFLSLHDFFRNKISLVFKEFRHVFEQFCHIFQEFCNFFEEFRYFFEEFRHVFAQFCHIFQEFDYFLHNLITFFGLNKNQKRILFAPKNGRKKFHIE